LPQVDQAGEAGKLSQGVGAAKASMPLTLINGLNRGLAGATCGLGVSGMVKAVRDYLWKQEWRLDTVGGGESSGSGARNKSSLDEKGFYKSQGEDATAAVCVYDNDGSIKPWSMLEGTFGNLARQSCSELVDSGLKFFANEGLNHRKEKLLAYVRDKNPSVDHETLRNYSQYMAQNYFYLRDNQRLLLQVKPAQSSDGPQTYQFSVDFMGVEKKSETEETLTANRYGYKMCWSYKQVPMSGVKLVKRLGVNGAMVVVGWNLMRWLGAHPIQARQAEVTPPPAAQKAESVSAKLTRVIRGEYVGGPVQAGAGASMMLGGALALVKSVQALRSLGGMTTFSALSTAQSAWTYGLPLGAILLARGVGTVYQMWG
jgi:hypothetical protein